MMARYQLSFLKQQSLRYGENPHQPGWVWQEKTSDPLAYFKHHQLQGKQLSFNNYLDIDAAVECLSFIGSHRPACVVVKHANPSGACVAETISPAFTQAWAADSLAAFGSVIAVNRKVTSALANLMLADNKFFEVLLCPSLSHEAKQIFSVKPNLRLLVNEALNHPQPNHSLDYKRIRGGLLVQPMDTYRLKPKDLKVVTHTKPTKNQLADLVFAWEICRISKANAVTLTKDEVVVANGVGQQDRVRSCQLAVAKAGPKAHGSVAASDAYFPFPDAPEILITAGVKALIQPGGSIRDQDTIDLCNHHDIPMVFTGIRCFKH